MQELIKLFTQIIKALYWINHEVFFLNAKKWQWHLSFVWTMKIAKELKKNGKDIAKEIADKIWQNELVSKFEIVEPWFLNMYLSDKALIEWLKEKK